MAAVNEVAYLIDINDFLLLASLLLFREIYIWGGKFFDVFLTLGILNAVCPKALRFVCLMAPENDVFARLRVIFLGIIEFILLWTRLFKNIPLFFLVILGLIDLSPGYYLTGFCVNLSFFNKNFSWSDIMSVGYLWIMLYINND